MRDDAFEALGLTPGEVFGLIRLQAHLGVAGAGHRAAARRLDGKEIIGEEQAAGPRSRERETPPGRRTRDAKERSRAPESRKKENRSRA
jgi:hypothetical protein